MSATGSAHLLSVTSFRHQPPSPLSKPTLPARLLGASREEGRAERGPNPWGKGAVDDTHQSLFAMYATLRVHWPVLQTWLGAGGVSAGSVACPAGEGLP